MSDAAIDTYAGPVTVQGRVEQVRDGIVEGWAWRPSDPSERVLVRLLLDGEEVGTAAADLPRPSLLAAGIGDGAHAFRFGLPELDGPHILAVLGGDDQLPPAQGFAVLGSGAELRMQPEGSTTESIEGRLEGIRDGTIEGWVWLPARPEERLTVTALLDDEDAGSVVADLPRPSLGEAGIGDGSHAFRLELSSELAHPGSRSLIVMAAGEALIPSTGFQIETTRSDTPWYGARFSLRAPEALVPEAIGNGGAVASPAARPRAPALVGLDGWLFDGSLVAIASEEEVLARAERGVAGLLDTLDQLNERVSQMDVKLLPVLLPTKEYVYRDLLPAIARELLADRPGDLVIRGLLAHPALEALDLLPALIAGADDLPVFLPGHSRLSEWGSFCAYRAMIKRVALMVPGVRPPVEIEPSAVLQGPRKRFSGPTAVLTEAGMIGCSPDELPLAPGEPVVIAPEGGPSSTPQEHLGRLDAELALGWEQPERRELPRCLLVGTEADEMLAGWCARHFRYTVLIGESAPVIDLASLERPDVILYLIDERALVGLR